MIIYLENTMTCDRNPCKNGGECITSSGSAKCVCAEGFFGKTCQGDSSKNLFKQTHWVEQVIALWLTYLITPLFCPFCSGG